MSLSSREILLVLRARDEASRTIGRVSSAMSRMDRVAMIEAKRQADMAETNLIGMRRHVHDVEESYRDQTYAARDARIANRITSKQYQQQMLDAARLRHEQLSTLRQQRQDTEDYIRTIKRESDAIYAQRERVRARGQALVANGAAAIGFGTAMTWAGVRGVQAFASTIEEAMEYESQVARTITQIDTFNAKQKDISNLGKEVADNIAVPLEQVQDGLYDIFSSIDVGFKGARKLINQFSKDAVGGTTDLETAGRANLQIMNAFKVETKDAAKVSDFMFQLVRKGVGTYDEFAKSIGRAIPSARRAGQSYETLGAMMAFMTRNGLSTAMAATSSARALDAISHPKTVARLEEMGIAVKNTAGEFKPLPKILEQMNDEYGDLTAPERAKALQDLFLGSGGTIQARRFFDNYFKNADEFNKRTKEMADSAGAAEDAYNRMAESPAAKLQQFQNDWKLLRIEIGENLMPAALKLVEWVNDLIDKFMDLDPKWRRIIELAAAALPVLLAISGVFLIIGGAVATVVGAFTMIGGSISGVLAAMAGVIGVVGLLIAAGVELYKNWEEVSAWIEKTFGPTFKRLADFLKNRAWPAIKTVADGVRDGLAEAFKRAKEGIEDARPLINRVVDAFIAVGDAVVDISPHLASLARTTLPLLGDAFAIFLQHVTLMGEIFRLVWNKALQPFFKLLVLAIGVVLTQWGLMLKILGKVPGFEWAKEASDAMLTAADAAKKTAQNIKDIPPYKKVTVEYVTIYSKRNKAKEKQLDFGAMSSEDVIRQTQYYKAMFNALIKDLATEAPKVGAAMDAARELVDKHLDKMLDGIKGKKAKDKFEKKMPKLRKSMLSDIKDAVKKDMADLDKLHQELKKKVAEIEKAQQDLDALISQKESFRSSIESMLKDFGSLGSLERPTDVFGNEGVWSAETISSQLQTKLAQIRQFGANLQKLLDMGFSKDVYYQVLQMGITDGAAFLEALLQATPDQIGSINASTAGISQSSKALADEAAKQMYDAGIATAQGLVDGLEKEKAAIMEKAKEIGEAIAKAIKKALGIKSPSKVALMISHNFGNTLADGLIDTKRNVEQASNILAQAMMFDPYATYSSTPVVGAASQGPGGPSKIVQQYIDIQTQEIDPRRHAEQLGWELANRGI